ncbi:MAG: hypothetical protein CSA66_07870 [Proteobacteria bacterium]|nr:MAG: hypothetical protein CSA66_07870 [Pseudomonadota bacterium]
MNAKQMLEIAGVFPAVKCAICDTIYPADTGDYVALYGRVSRGLDDVLVDVASPTRPAKKAIVVVCREPSCMQHLVRQLLGCTPDSEDGDALWAQVLSLWARDAGHTLAERPETRPAPPARQLRARKPATTKKVSKSAATKKRA